MRMRLRTALAAPHAANVTMQPRLPYDTLADIAAFAFVRGGRSVVAVHPSVGARTLPEPVVRAEREDVPFGSPGVGFSAHLAGERLRIVSGGAFTHVADRGAGPALDDALGGQIPMVIGNVASMAPHAREGRLRALAVTGAERSPLLPDVPTSAQQGDPECEVVEWLVLVGPRDTPPAVAETDAFVTCEVEKLGTAVRERDLAGGSAFADLVRTIWERVAGRAPDADFTTVYRHVADRIAEGRRADDPAPG